MRKLNNWPNGKGFRRSVWYVSSLSPPLSEGSPDVPAAPTGVCSDTPGGTLAKSGVPRRVTGMERKLKVPSWEELGALSQEVAVLLLSEHPLLDHCLLHLHLLTWPPTACLRPQVRMVFLGLLRASPMAHGGSQARGPVGAASATYATAHNAGSLTH